MFSETKRVILLRRELKIRTKISIKKGLTGGSEVRNLPAMREPQETVFHPWVGKIPWRMAWQSSTVFLPGESPWTEEPDRLQSMGVHRVRHN